MSNQLTIKPVVPEWELLEPMPEIPRLTSEDLHRAMAFNSFEMFYGSPPCAHFAARLDEKKEAQA